MPKKQKLKTIIFKLNNKANEDTTTLVVDFRINCINTKVIATNQIICIYNIFYLRNFTDI